jgi:hypothetical protein
MKENVGNADRIARFAIGAAIMAAGIYYESWWGLLGLVTITTGLLRFCPAYVPLGMSTKPETEEKG